MRQTRSLALTLLPLQLWAGGADEKPLLDAFENVRGSRVRLRDPHTASCCPARLPGACSLWSGPCPMGNKAGPPPGPRHCREVSSLGLLQRPRRPTACRQQGETLTTQCRSCRRDGLMQAARGARGPGESTAWVLPPAHCHLSGPKASEGGSQGAGGGPGPPSFSAECWSLALRCQRASPLPPGPRPPAGLGGP